MPVLGSSSRQSARCFLQRLVACYGCILTRNLISRCNIRTMRPRKQRSASHPQDEFLHIACDNTIREHAAVATSSIIGSRRLGEVLMVCNKRADSAIRLHGAIGLCVGLVSAFNAVTLTGFLSDWAINCRDKVPPESTDELSSRSGYIRVFLH